VSEARAPRATAWQRLVPAAVLALAAAIVAALLVPSGVLAGKDKGKVVKVMTRNVYLGADLTPALNAANAEQFSEANGKILRDVDTNNFPVRARGLAREIRGKSPDLVGLQEVALWRTNENANLGPALDPNTPKTATTVHPGGDFLALLMARLNQGKKRYRIVKVQQEFDFEAPADYNDTEGDGDPAVSFLMPDAEMNGRLTMRDVLIAKVKAGVRTSKVKGGNFETIYNPTISGVPVRVDRGWVSADVVVRGSRKFRFVNTHLEAFGDPSIREAQAKELVAKGGPARGPLPVVLVGDLNSDDNTVSGDDRKAYLALKRKGFVDRATERPMSCCLNTSILTDNFGSVSDFDHHIDHILTNRPRKVKRISAAVTGRSPANGFWDSDHAGVFSKLRLLP
jgi:endonuclease/exonuclease/phosphatase family metal-dependent hydrolase